jgi:MOSC domain-containing protein YiiM
MEKSIQNMEIVSVNVSTEKGVVKQPVTEVRLTNTGIEGDAHAGEWHRQVSLLAEESIKRFEKILGRELQYGEFAENFTTRGVELKDCQVGDTFIGNGIELEVTQIGKKCHGSGCAIFQLVGNCIMPVEGIFCKVVQGGVVKPTDSFVYYRKQ